MFSFLISPLLSLSMSLSLLLRRRSGVTTMMTPRMLMSVVLAPNKAYFHNSPSPAKNAATAAAIIRDTGTSFGAVVSLNLAKDQHFDL